jgi:hypothetical protein
MGTFWEQKKKGKNPPPLPPPAQKLQRKKIKAL